ncbi:MAG TPA: flavin reductase family protein [Myxococcota bacterium]|nr:flavin reductase family protein [Myxococcota bacterium]
MPVDRDTFKRSLGSWASGVTIVTAQHGGARLGMTVSAFSSVSLDPPLVLVCADKASNTNVLIQKSQAFTVNVLGRAHSALSNLFADKKRESVRFDGLDCKTGATGAPRLPGVLACIDCSVREEIDAGDHIVYVGSVEASTIDAEQEPLVYWRGVYQKLTPL